MMEETRGNRADTREYGPSMKSQTGSAGFRLEALLEDECGQDIVEYALLACLLGLAAVASIRTVGTRVVASFMQISNTLNGSF